MNNEQIEKLSAEIHTLYQAEAKRQGDVRHHDDYEVLPENIKEFDRVIARFILSRDRQAFQELEKEFDGLRKYNLHEKDNVYKAILLDDALAIIIKEI